MMAQPGGRQKDAPGNHQHTRLADIGNGKHQRQNAGKTAQGGDGALEPGHARSPIRFSVKWLTTPTMATRMAAMQAAEISADQIWMVCP